MTARHDDLRHSPYYHVVEPPLTLAEWLLERLDEDEAVARAARAVGRAGWPVKTVFDHPDQVMAIDFGDGDAAWHQWTRLPLDVATHIARHDPARVLADVEAKRRIVALFVDCAVEQRCDTDELFFGETLRLLALPYAGHEDYRAEWAP